MVRNIQQTQGESRRRERQRFPAAHGEGHYADCLNPTKPLHEKFHQKMRVKYFQLLGATAYGLMKVRTYALFPTIPFLVLGKNVLFL